MEPLMTYLLRSSLWLTTFGVIYFLFLRNERFFRLNRLFLLSGLLASIFFPLITINYQVPGPVSTGNVSAESLIPGEIQAGQGSSLSIEMVLMGIILAGALFFFAKLLWQTFRIIHEIRKSDTTQINATQVVRSNKFPLSFSFFDFIIVNPSISEDESREIIAHESAHVHQKHWVDLLLAESLKIIQWFNPMAWLYCHLIRENHEFLADQSALQSTSSPAIYKAVLLNQVMGGEVIRLGHSFNYSLNKKRFIMMKTDNKYSAIRMLKALLILPAMALVFYACAEPVYENQENEASNEEELSNAEKKSVSKTEETSDEEEPFFFVVEEMPEFPGKEEALNAYLSESIEYPEEAIKSGIQGRVYVRFIITKTGKVSDVEIARGVDPNLDKEAMRVVKEMPDWKPGKQKGEKVSVSYTVPINFQLEEEKNQDNVE